MSSRSLTAFHIIHNSSNNSSNTSHLLSIKEKEEANRRGTKDIPTSLSSSSSTPPVFIIPHIIYTPCIVLFFTYFFLFLFLCLLVLKNELAAYTHRG